MDRYETLVMGVDPGSEYVGVSMGVGLEKPMTFIWSPGFFLLQMEGTTITRLAIERFDMRQFTLESVATVKLIGVIEFLCHQKQIKMGYVNASDKRKFLPRIKEEYPEITSHALDAEAIRRYDLVYGTW